MTHRPLPALLGTLLLAGCPIGNNKYPKPQDLSPAWSLDRLRVLAIRAEPPEIRPGETATFSALVIDPNDEAGAVIWLACATEADDPGGIGFGCPVDAGIDFEEASLEELQEAGFIGFEPILTPRYTAPIDMLDGLDEIEAREGRYVLAQTVVLPEDVLESGSADGFDFNKVEVAYKRLIVSEATTPNHNPDIYQFRVDGLPIPPGASVELDPGQLYEIGVLLTSEAIEFYEYTDGDGNVEQREEQPYVKWYADGGVVGEELTLFPYLDADWTAPERDDGVTSGTVWAVVRDRRGGMGWAGLRWTLRP